MFANPIEWSVALVLIGDRRSSSQSALRNEEAQADSQAIVR